MPPQPRVDLTVVDGEGWVPADEGAKVYRYRTEYAASGRSKCQRCGEGIEKDKVRVGIPVKWKCWINAWCHPGCLRTEEKGDDLAGVIFGFAKLKKKDQKQLIETLNGEPLKAHELTEDDWLPSCSASGIEPLDVPSLPLLPFQKIGTGWMVHQERTPVKGGLLADEMGMGKTLQTIGLLVHTKASNSPTLVITPASALGQWEEEVAKFAPSLKVLVFHTNRKNLKPAEFKKYNVVLTTFSVLEAEYRKIVNQAKVTCKYCSKKFLPSSLKNHLQYFCGPKAVRSAKQQLREKKSMAAAEKAKATLGIGSSVPSMTNIYKEIMHESGRTPIGRYDKGSKALQREAEQAAKSITVQPIGMKPFYVDPEDNLTVRKLQDAIQNRYGVKPADQRLIYNKELLKAATKKLSTIGIGKGDTVHVSFDIASDASSNEGSAEEVQANGKKPVKKTAKPQSSDSEESSAPKKAKKTGAKKSKKAAEPSSSEADSESEEPNPAKKSIESSESGSASDSESAEPPKKKPAAKKSAKKPAAKRGKQVESSESDSESDSESAEPPKKKPAKKSAKKPAGKKAQVQEDSSSSEASESGDESDSESSDRAPKKSSQKAAKKPVKKVAKKPAGKAAKKSKSAESSSSESTEPPLKTAKTGKGKGKTPPSESSSGNESGSESESESESVAPKKPAKKGKKPAGKKQKGKKATDSSDDSSGSSDGDSDSESASGSDVDTSGSERVGKKRKHSKTTKLQTKDDQNKLNFSESPLYRFTWTRLVVDEAHRIKARTTSTAKAVYALKSDYKWGLTGTPLQNRVGELFSLIRFLSVPPFAYYLCSAKDCKCTSLEWMFGWGRSECEDCGHTAMRHYSYFNKFILNPISRYGYVGEGLRAFERLKNEVLSVIQLRRTKVEVASDVTLPALKVIIHKGHLDEREKDFYEALYKRSTAKFDGYVSKGTLMHNYAHIFELLARLRQAVDHPYIVTKNKLNTADVKKATTRVQCSICGEEILDKGKAVKVPCRHVFHTACCELYLELSVGDEVACPGFCCEKSFKKNSVVECGDEEEPETQAQDTQDDLAEGLDAADFTSSTKLEDLVKYVKAMPAEDKGIVFSQYNGMLDLVKWRLQKEGVTVAKLTGSLGVDRRTKLLAEFKSNPEVRIILLSLRAGGEGLNLQVANHVFTLDPWWNPAAELQAIQRAHRIGQTKPVTAVRFVTQDTIEERMYQLQEKKQLVFDGTIDGSNAALARLSGDDIAFLFNH